MVKKTITYTDYNDNERTEDFYFNLSKAEVLELELSANGGITEMLTRMIAAQDMASLIKIVKEVVLKGYGEKSLDGKQFIKSQELSTAFSQTEAYSQLFVEVATNADVAEKFINAMLPNKKPENTTAASQNIKPMPGLAPLTIQ